MNTFKLLALGGLFFLAGFIFKQLTFPSRLCRKLRKEYGILKIDEISYIRFTPEFLSTAPQTKIQDEEEGERLIERLFLLDKKNNLEEIISQPDISHFARNGKFFIRYVTTCHWKHFLQKQSAPQLMPDYRKKLEIIRLCKYCGGTAFIPCRFCDGSGRKSTEVNLCDECLGLGMKACSWCADLQSNPIPSCIVNKY